MPITPISEQAISAYQSSKNKPLETPTTQALPSGLKEVTEITVRNEKQAIFVSHFFENSEDKDEGALKITYQLAIEKLNERFEAETGEKNVISEENLKKQGGIDYWSPENVAQRIVQGTTAFLDGFQKAHPELSGETLINKFLEVISGGVQQGFSEAQGVLKELDVFDGKVAENYQTTFDLVQKGFEAFRRQQLGLAPLEPETHNTASSEPEKQNQ